MEKSLSLQGPSGAKILIVLDNASYADIYANEYLSGAAGAGFDKLISRAGLSRANIQITSVINSSLPSGSVSWLYDKKKGTLKPEFAALYMSNMFRLRKEIADCDPNVIVAMGSYALNFLTGKGSWNGRSDNNNPSGVVGWTGISDWRGSIIEATELFGKRKVVAMQPIYTIMDQWRLHPFWVSDMVRVVEQSHFPEIRRHPRKLIIDPPRDEQEYLIEQLLASPDPISFDIEHYNGKLLCTGFCAYSNWSLTIRNKGPETVDVYRRVLESGHALCAQNAMFDCSLLEWHEGIVTFPHLTYDTILAAHAAHIELPKDLGTLCSIYTEEPCYWDKTDWKQLGKSWAFESMLEYNCLDAWVTHEVRREQLIHDLSDPSVRATFDFELALLQPLWDISKRGIRWSFEQVEKVRADAQAGLAAAQQIIDTLYPEFNGLNVSSSKQVAQLIYDKLGVEPELGKRGTSERSTNDLVLASIACIPKYAKSPVGAAISVIRNARKHKSMLSKFAGTGDDDSGIQVDNDGRFRSTYVPSATDTGRLSAKIFFPTGRGANAQNQPRDKEVRRCFVPDTGYIIGYNDLERAESFVVAKVTGDRTMLEHHLPGRNAHRLLGSTLFGKAPEELNDDEYYLAKKTRHAGNYMQGWKTFMNNVNKEAEKTGIILDVKTAKHLINTYREMHVGLQRWWRNVEYEVKSTRKLYNLFGRPRTFYGRVDAELPAAIAFIPQSTVGDCMNYAILNLWRAGIVGRPDSKVQMLAQIHDALVYQFPDEGHEANMATLRTIREHMLVPIVNPLDGEEFIINTMPSVSAVSWGDCKELKPAELGIV